MEEPTGRKPKYHIRIESAEEGAIGEWDCEAYILIAVENTHDGPDPEAEHEVIQTASRGMGTFKRLGVAHWLAALYEGEVLEATEDKERS